VSSVIKKEIKKISQPPSPTDFFGHRVRPYLLNRAAQPRRKITPPSLPSSPCRVALSLFPKRRSFLCSPFCRPAPSPRAALLQASPSLRAPAPMLRASSLLGQTIGLPLLGARHHGRCLLPARIPARGAPSSQRARLLPQLVPDFSSLDLPAPSSPPWRPVELLPRHAARTLLFPASQLAKSRPCSSLLSSSHGYRALLAPLLLPPSSQSSMAERRCSPCAQPRSLPSPSMVVPLFSLALVSLSSVRGHPDPARILVVAPSPDSSAPSCSGFLSLRRCSSASVLASVGPVSPLRDIGCELSLISPGTRIKSDRC
jgi:hypothetical protein